MQFTLSVLWRKTLEHEYQIAGTMNGCTITLFCWLPIRGKTGVRLLSVSKLERAHTHTNRMDKNN